MIVIQPMFIWSTSLSPKDLKSFAAWLLKFIGLILAIWMIDQIVEIFTKMR